MYRRVLPLLALPLLALAQINDAETALEGKLKATKTLRSQLFKGEVPADPNNKAHLEAIDVAAKEVLYPLHWKAGDLKPKTTPSKILIETVDEAERLLGKLATGKDRTLVAALHPLYARALVVRARDVILSGPPIAAVNAARVISFVPRRAPGQDAKRWTDEVVPRLGGDTAESLLGVCADLIPADPKKVNDGVRVYLLRAAQDTLAVPKQTPPLYKAETADKVVAAAMGVLGRKVEFTRASPAGEVEGFKMLRAEALAVVARAAAPAAGKDRPAMALARAAADDEAVVPRPRVEETIEGAVGLCRLVAGSAKYPDFNPDYAAHQVARAVRTFTLQADANAEKKGGFRLRPWKVDAARLLEAVEMMRASKDPHVAEVVKQCRVVLQRVEGGTAGEGNTLNPLIEAAPPNASLFKGGDPSALKPRAPAVPAGE